MIGQNFDRLPEVIRGWGATTNSNPAGLVGENDPHYLYHVVSRTATEIVMELAAETSFSAPGYFGAITNAENEVLWVNETAPLP